MDFHSIDHLADRLEAGEVTARALVEAALAKATDAAGEGKRVFMSLNAEGAMAAADAIDALRANKMHPSRHAGIPISVKDLFDMKGQVTAAGSRILADAKPATADAPAIAHLRQAGFIPIGRTTMTEFAYSGLGLNPHYSTPSSPYDRAARRIPGGSSSGAAVSVADGMAAGATGTDTGGSCRIPAAMCAIVGYKPTASRISRQGVYPLSESQDSVGGFGRTVRCVEILDAVMAGGAVPDRDVAALAGLRLAVPRTYVMDGLDDKVAADFDAALNLLRDAGAHIRPVAFAGWADFPTLLSKGGLVAAEAFKHHQGMLEDGGDLYDPRVRLRIANGAKQSACEYVEVMEARKAMIADAEREAGGFDAVILPTTPAVAPTIASLEEDDALYGSTNLLMLRNPTVFNFLDGCALSIPMHADGTAPTGLMIAGLNGWDRRIFSAGHAIEAALAGN